MIAFISISLQHLEPGTMPYTPEQEFGEMTLSDYDSNEDADYEPSESEDSDDELEFNSDASVSEDSEVEHEEEVLVKEELVEEMSLCLSTDNNYSTNMNSERESDAIVHDPSDHL